MKELTLPHNPDSYEESLRHLLLRSQMRMHRASGGLTKTHAGQRAAHAFLHLTINLSKELTAADWMALATLSLAAAHSAEEAACKKGT